MGATRKGVVALAPLVALLLAALVTYRPVVGVLAAVVLAMLGLFLAPLWSLPSIALVAWALAPVGYLPGRTMTAVFPPSALVALVLLGRVVTGRAKSPEPLSAWEKVGRTALVALIVWALTSVAWSISPHKSVYWAVDVALLVGVFALSGRALPARARTALKSTWLVLGSALGGFAIVEFLLKQNPVYGGVLVIGVDEAPLAQHWSVYRVTTTLGHPLVNGLFFATAYALSLAILSRGEAQHRRFALISAPLSLAGAMLTISRTAVIVVVISSAVTILSSIAAQRVSLARKLAVGTLVLVALGGVYSSGIIQERLGTAEAVDSATVRGNVRSVVTDAMRANGLTGTGAGTSPVTAPTLQPDLRIENSYLELFVGAGAPAVLLFLTVLGAGVVHGVRRGEYSAAAVTIAYGVYITGFNAGESNRPTLVLFGLAMLLCSGASERLVPVDNRLAATTRPRALTAAGRT